LLDNRPSNPFISPSIWAQFEEREYEERDRKGGENGRLEEAAGEDDHGGLNGRKKG